MPTTLQQSDLNHIKELFRIGLGWLHNFQKFLMQKRKQFGNLIDTNSMTLYNRKQKYKRKRNKKNVS